MLTRYFKKFFFLLLFCVFTVILSAAETGIIDRLNSSERSDIREGKLLYKEKEKDDAPWPERRIYTILDATPLEAVAVFGDYEYQKEYVPGMVKAEVVRQDSSTEVVVAYESDMPWPIMREKFTNHHRLRSYGVANGTAYEVSWNQIEGSSAKESFGFARFEPYDDGKTLMEYMAFIHPISPLAGLKGIKKRAKENFLETVKAVIAHIETVAAGRPDLLREKTKKITDALNGTPVY